MRPIAAQLDTAGLFVLDGSAVIGDAMGAMLDIAENPDADYLAAFDRGLAHLDAGLPL